MRLFPLTVATLACSKELRSQPKAEQNPRNALATHSFPFITDLGKQKLEIRPIEAFRFGKPKPRSTAEHGKVRAIVSQIPIEV